MLVWVTRAQPGADATATALSELGHEPLVAPLLTVEPLTGVRLELDGVAALAFTSANAVRAFAALTPRRDLPAFAVGSATAIAAQAAGLTVRAVGGSDAAGLAEVLAQARLETGVVLHPTSEDPAADLAGELRGRKIQARAIVLYRTRPADGPPAAAAGALRAGALRTVLLHSPRAARTLAGLLDAERPAVAAGLTAFGLSPSCLAPLARSGLSGLKASDRPSEIAMLSLLDCAPR